MKFTHVSFGLLIAVSFGITACSVSHQPVAGPDRQVGGSVQGAVTGAGAGAVTGFQVGAGTGPGALVGAGLGAIAGGIQGAVQDRDDDQLLALNAKTRSERELAYAHEILNDQFKRRIELHPTREIYPADLFFHGDETKLKREAAPIVRALASLNKERLPWSRLVVASYVKAVEAESEYAKHLAEGRSRELIVYLVRAGIEPRRLVTRAVIINQPLLVDPHDRPERYNQAIELIPIDR